MQHTTCSNAAHYLQQCSTLLLQQCSTLPAAMQHTTCSNAAHYLQQCSTLPAAIQHTTCSNTAHYSCMCWSLTECECVRVCGWMRLRGDGMAASEHGHGLATVCVTLSRHNYRGKGLWTGVTIVQMTIQHISHVHAWVHRDS